MVVHIPNSGVRTTVVLNWRQCKPVRCRDWLLVHYNIMTAVMQFSLWRPSGPHVFIISYHFLLGCIASHRLHQVEAHAAVYFKMMVLCHVPVLSTYDTQHDIRTFFGGFFFMLSKGFLLIYFLPATTCILSCFLMPFWVQLQSVCMR